MINRRTVFGYPDIQKSSPYGTPGPSIIGYKTGNFLVQIKQSSIAHFVDAELEVTVTHESNRNVDSFLNIQSKPITFELGRIRK